MGVSALIHTKLVVEVEPAKFLSLGFGNIANSKADVVCVSSFRESAFVPDSSIGAVARALGGKQVSLSSLLRMHVGQQDERLPGGCTLLNLLPIK